MLMFHHLQTSLSENIVIFCFQSHRVLLINFQESVCHGMGITCSVSTGTLPNPCCSAGTKSQLQTRLCNPLPQSRMYSWGQKSGKLLRNINIKKVFGFRKPNFRVYNISSFKNFRSVEELVPPRTSKQLSGPRGVPRRAGSGPGTQSANQHQPEQTPWNQTALLS